MLTQTVSSHDHSPPLLEQLDTEKKMYISKASSSSSCRRWPSQRRTRWERARRDKKDAACHCYMISWNRVFSTVYKDAGASIPHIYEYVFTIIYYRTWWYSPSYLVQYEFLVLSSMYYCCSFCLSTMVFILYFIDLMKQNRKHKSREESRVKKLSLYYVLFVSQ